MSKTQQLILDSDENLHFCPAESCCYVCGRTEIELLEQGPAIGKLCGSCVLGFAS